MASSLYCHDHLGCNHALVCLHQKISCGRTQVLIAETQKRKGAGHQRIVTVCLETRCCVWQFVVPAAASPQRAWALSNPRDQGLPAQLRLMVQVSCSSIVSLCELLGCAWGAASAQNTAMCSPSDCLAKKSGAVVSPCYLCRLVGRTADRFCQVHSIRALGFLP